MTVRLWQSFIERRKKQLNISILRRQDCCCVIRSSRATLVNRQSRGGLERGANMGNKSTQIGKTQFWASFLPTVSRRLIWSLESWRYTRRSSHDAASQTKRLLPTQAPLSPLPLSNLFSQITLPFLTNPSPPLTAGIDGGNDTSKIK